LENISKLRTEGFATCNTGMQKVKSTIALSGEY